MRWWVFLSRLAYASLRIHCVAVTESFKLCVWQIGFPDGVPRSWWDPRRTFRGRATAAGAAAGTLDQNEHGRLSTTDWADKELWFLLL